MGDLARERYALFTDRPSIDDLQLDEIARETIIEWRTQRGRGRVRGRAIAPAGRGYRTGANGRRSAKIGDVKDT